MLSHVFSLQPDGQVDPPGSSVDRIFQSTVLEWVAFPFTRGSPLACLAGRFFTTEPSGKLNFP